MPAIVRNDSANFYVHPASIRVRVPAVAVARVTFSCPYPPLEDLAPPPPLTPA